MIYATYLAKLLLNRHFGKDCWLLFNELYYTLHLHKKQQVLDIRENQNLFCGGTENDTCISRFFS